MEVHEFDGSFRGTSVRFKVTSVIGHVLSIDFPPKYQSWDTTDPFELFEAPTIKNESNPKAHVCKHLQQEARGCDYLVLWLDCDREGENICFEVMESAVPVLRKLPGQQVFRAKFSAISEKDVRVAMNTLGEPNKDESLSVDARQEIDLKVGVAFTRFQTRYFQGKYGNLDSSVISYVSWVWSLSNPDTRILCGTPPPHHNLRSPAFLGCETSPKQRRTSIDAGMGS